MREWLFDFDPESMSDLVLLNAIYWPGRTQLFPELLRSKQTGDYDKQYKDTYGIPIYQEQTGDPNLAPKGHFIARTMLAVEALI
jgi:DNA polymerase III alpha subunit